MPPPRKHVGREYLHANDVTSESDGREYLRVSMDRSGCGKSNTEQHDENVIAAANFHITLGEHYADPDRSASRYARRAREEFDRLLGDLRAGRFGADYLVLWESSRGSRQVGEWVTLIDLLEEHGVKVLVTTHGRVYDPANPRDRRTLLEDAVDSEYESSKSHLRIRRDTAAAATKGRPHGRAPVGYRRVYDSKTGELVGQEIDEDTAPMVRELFERIKGGHSLRSIEIDFRERGVRNGSGSHYTAQHLRVIALRHCYVGIRVHDAGRHTGGGSPSPDARLVPAQWPALVSQADFLAVQDVLRDPKRRTTVTGRGRHFISMIARCGVCLGPMSTHLRSGTPKLICKDAGHTKIVMADLDEYAEDMLKGFIGDPEQYGRLDGDEEDTAERLRVVRDALAVTRSERKDLTRRVNLHQKGLPGGLSMEMAADLEPDLITREKELAAKERDLMTPSAVSRLLGPGEDLDQRWENTPMAARRELAQLVFSPAGLGRLLVFRSPKPGVRVPVEQRVGFEQSDG